MDWIRVEGDSMQPCLKPGDWIAVDWVNPASPTTQKHFHPGDLVLAKDLEGDSSHWLVHRVIRTPPEDFSIKGDAAFAWDGLSIDRVWGRVTHVRKGHDKVPPKPLTHHFLDRWIAFFSNHTLPSESFKAKLARRAVRGLGTLRRAFL